jgi:hypothetical protein
MPEEISFPKEQSTIPDELRSPIKHHVLLLRIDREQDIRRFYSLTIERNLLRTARLVRNWGSTGPVRTTRCVSLPPQEGCCRCTRAHMAAWVRLAALTFLRMLLMWSLTVASARPS